MNTIFELHQLLWPVSGQGSSLCSMSDSRDYRFEPRKAFYGDPTDI